MKSSALNALLCLLFLLGTTHCACVENSSVVIYSGKGRINRCKGLSLNTCNDSTVLCSSGIWGCCNYQKCTSELLGFVSCPDTNNSDGLVIQITENTTLTHTYVFSNLSSVEIDGVGENITVECMNNVGVIFEKVVSVVIQNIKWVNCGGSHIDLLEDVELSGALLLIQSSQVRVINSHFFRSVGAGVVFKTRIVQKTDNQTDLFNYYLENSTFRDSSNRSSSSHAGGGVSVHTLQYISDTESVGNKTRVSLRLNSCSFLGNSAFSGGGVFISTYNADGKVAELGADVEFQMCTFIDNIAFTTGGAVTIVGAKLGDSYIFFNDCDFLSNQAVVAGGAVHIGIHSEVGNVHIGFSSCHWQMNEALESSSLSVRSPRPKSYIHGVTITNSTMVSNFAQLENFDAQCTASFGGISKVVLKDVNISNNIGSGLCLFRSVVVVNGTVWISYNHRARNGGGIFLQYESYISLTLWARLSVESNTAVYGGGLFVTQPFRGVCFLNSTEDCAAVSLTNNQALFNGGTIYFEDPDESCKTELESLCTKDYEKTDINSAVIDGVNVTLDNGTMFLFPGQQIQLIINMKDFFNNSGKVNVRVNLHPHNTEYYLSGSTQFTLQDGVNRPNLTIYGTQPTDAIMTYVLEIASLDKQSSIVSQEIPLTITQCPLGYNNSSKYCNCSTGVECNDFTGMSCIPKGEWFGSFPDSSSPLILLSCSSGYCSNIDNCTPCATEGDYCVLSNSQCIQSRVGPMCLECPEGDSYTFGAIQCADSKLCKFPGLLTSLFIVIYCILSFVLLFLILKFTKGTTLGALFCFVYYFSVIDLVLPQSIVHNNILSIVYVGQSFTQLNPKFLGLVPICVAKEASILALQYLLYVSPVVVWAIVILLVLCSRRCSKRFQFSDRTPITVISLLILLTFTAFTKTSFNIVLPTTFQNVSGTYVNIAPNTKYFSSLDHQIFVVIAVIVLLLGVLPFTSFLFMAPFLGQYCNVMRIKPFLDEFQACYKDEYRWMAGFYFLCRIPFFLSQLFQQVAVGEYVTQFLSLTVLLFHVILQPYRKKWLNVTDTILLADILCFSLLYGNTAQVIFRGIVTARDIISFVLILIPIFQMSLLLLVGLHYRYPVLKQYCTHCVSQKKEMASRSDSLLSVPYREPLLTMDDSFDRPQLTDYETGTSHWNSAETSRGYASNFTSNSRTGDSYRNLPSSTEISLEILAETDSSEY